MSCKEPTAASTCNNGLPTRDEESACPQVGEERIREPDVKHEARRHAPPALWCHAGGVAHIPTTAIRCGISISFVLPGISLRAHTVALSSSSSIAVRCGVIREVTVGYISF